MIMTIMSAARPGNFSSDLLYHGPTDLPIWELDGEASNALLSGNFPDDYDFRLVVAQIAEQISHHRANVSLAVVMQVFQLSTDDLGVRSGSFRILTNIEADVGRMSSN